VLQPGRNVRLRGVFFSSALTSSNALSTIHEDERDNRHIVLRFYPIIIFLQVSQERSICGVEDSATERGQLGKDITSRGMIFTALVTRTVLAIGQEEIQVIAPNVVLGQVHDSHSQTGFAMMVCSNLRDITNKLGDLHE
jgi:hypothetical protein